MASRLHQRVPGRFKVEYRSASALLAAYTVNLSRGGVFLQTDELPPIGTSLSLEIALPDRSIVSLRGTITWHREDADASGPRGVGLRFDETSPELGNIIDGLVTDFAGILILVQCADVQDRKTLLRMLKSIVSTAEIIFADDDSVASNLLGSDTDLVVVDVDENEEAAINTLKLAQGKHDVPSVALAEEPQAIAKATAAGADQIVCNPPSSSALSRAVLQLLSSPRRVSPASDAGTPPPTPAP